MIRYLSLFLVLTLTGLTLLPLEAVQPAIDLFCLGLARVSWAMIHLFDASVTLTGAVMRHGSTGFALEVTDQCSALKVSWLLAAAVLAYPAPWRLRLRMLVFGLLALQAFNIVRLISLVYLGEWVSRARFDWVHHSTWPIFLHLFALLVFFRFLWTAFPAERCQQSVIK